MNRRTLLALAALTSLVGTAALLWLVPATAAAGLLAAGPAVGAVAMVRALRRGTASGPRLRTATLAAGGLLAGLASAAGGVAVVLAPGVHVDGVPLPAEIPLVALVITAGLYLVGVLLPHQPLGPLARIGVVLDASGVAIGLIYTPWLLLFGGEPEPRGASVTALLVGGVAAATAVAAGVHAVRHRAALLWCGPGTALSVVGLTAMVVAMDFPGEANAVIAAGAAAAAVDAAAILIWTGAVRVRPDSGPLPPVGEPAAGLPLFTVPLLASALATAFHLLGGHTLDPVAVTLVVAGVVVIATREYVAAVVLRRHADHLTTQGNRLRALVFGSSDVAVVLDAEFAVRWQSPAAARQFGLSDQDVLGRPVAALVHPDDTDEFLVYLAARMGPRAHAAPPTYEVRLRDGFGRWRATEWAINGSDPAEPGRSLVIHIRDVSDRRDLAETLRQAANVDRQTTLVNRQGLRRAAEPVPAAGALIVVEMGGVATVGDVHGPDLADVVVVEAARRLRAAIDDADVPARLGEARFAVLTRCGAVRAHLLASQLLNALTAPYGVAGKVAHLSATAGLADLSTGLDIDEVVRRATLALRAIGPGRSGTIEWYDEAMEIRLVRRGTLEQDLPRALSRGELDLTYQPIVELPGRRPAGVAAVLRWKHPTLGPVPADELLELAEQTGLLGELGRWVLQRAGRQLAGWRRRHPRLWLSVDTHPHQLADPMFHAVLETVLRTYGIPASALVLEIAERDLVTARAAGSFDAVADQLNQLRAADVRIAVDDFGAGPTSLSQLRVLPVDLLKVDPQVFAAPAELADLMRITVTLGHQLNLSVVAQGMRTPDDLSTVTAAGCEFGQGDLIAAALPPEHLEAWLDGSAGGRSYTSPAGR